MFRFIVDGPVRVLHGLGEILMTRDALLTDYFGVGGIGAAFVNAGLLTLCACVVYRLANAGSWRVGRVPFLVLGFGLFGKNLLNVWFIVARRRCTQGSGASRSRRTSIRRSSAPRSPRSSRRSCSAPHCPSRSGCRSRWDDLVIGFILAPAAAQLFKAHMGFSLYNMGFTAGIVGTLVVAAYKSYGFVPARS